MIQGRVDRKEGGGRGSTAGGQEGGGGEEQREGGRWGWGEGGKGEGENGKEKGKMRGDFTDGYDGMPGWTKAIGLSCMQIECLGNRGYDIH